MLQSQLFAGDPLLESIADGSPERISRTQHKRDPAVGKVQQALLLWRADLLPVHGVDSAFGDETAAAVVIFKTEELQVVAPFPDVGPLTVIRLDEIALAAEQPIVPPPSPRIRHDIWRLQPTAAEPWHPFVDAYERAIGIMKAPNAEPPLHWGWQAAIHGIAGLSGDPHLDQCQHGTYFFLPWHRIYLANFEQALIAIIQELPDVTDETKETWALPYWNYHRPGTGSIPFPFRASMRGGRPNNLFEARPGGMPLPRTALDTSSWLEVSRPFSAPPDGNPMNSVSFGGERTGVVHDAGEGTGMIEFAPHNLVHSRIGGKMGNPNTAGLDPVFWLHHANVDRLWEVWRRNIGFGRDEVTQVYLTQSFPFLELDGQASTPWTPGDVVETVQLGYAYEDLSQPAPVFVNGRPVAPPPPPGPPGGGDEGLGDAPGEAIDAPEPPGEQRPLPAPRTVQRIGALEQTLRLRGGETPTIEMALDPPPVRQFDEGDEGIGPEIDEAHEPPTRYYIRVAHLTMQRESNRLYEIYLDPDGEGPLEPRFVAELPTFGLTRSEEADAEHGLSFTFEVTEIVEDLARDGAWNPELAHISLRLDGVATEDSPDPEISIGSIDLFAG